MKQINTTTFMTDYRYRKLRKLHPEIMKSVRIAVGGKRNLIGLQMGIIKGRLISLGESDASVAFSNMIDQYNQVYAD